LRRTKGELKKMADPQNTHNNEPKANKRSTAAIDFQAGALSKPGGDGKTGAATATARSFYDQAKETAGQAYDAVTDQAANKLDEQKSSLSGGLTTVADSVRQVSDNLVSSKTESGLAEAAAKYTGTAAQKIEDVAGYFESRSVRDMARDLEDFARRNPAVFIGAAFGLGLLAARFLKSTSPRYDEARTGREFAASAGADGRLKVPSKGAANNPNLSNGPM
jgi:ElaB/YqjD/DUF883 family membrane-anchored ribosome-binding protein